MKSIINALKALWAVFRRPSKAAVGVVLFMGFIGGLLFWGAFNTGMEATNTEEFALDVMRRLWLKSKKRFTMLTALVFVQSVPIVMCPMIGPIKLFERYKLQKSCSLIL